MFVFSFLPFVYDHQRERTRSALCHVCYITLASLSSLSAPVGGSMDSDLLMTTQSEGDI